MGEVQVRTYRDESGDVHVEVTGTSDWEQSRRIASEELERVFPGESPELESLPSAIIFSKPRGPIF